MSINELKDIKGVGDKTEKSLNELSIFKPIDLLEYFPIRYERFEEKIDIANIHEGITVTIEAVVTKKPSIFGRRMPIVTTILADGTAKIKAIWFNSPFLLHSLYEGKKYIFRGKVYKSGNTLSLNQAKIYSLEQYEDLKGKIIPIYRSSKSIKGTLISKVIANYLSSTDKDELLNDKYVEEYIPDELLKKNNLLNISDSYITFHKPENENDLNKARKRLVYGEFLLYELGLKIFKGKSLSNGYEELANKKRDIVDQVINNLPYKLTKGQIDAINAIFEDFNNKKLLNRLIEGDVGSGKTIVAFLIMLFVADNNMQSVLMAPTEVLASQHFNNLSKILSDMGLNFNIALLTGSTKKKDRDIILKGLKDGKINILIGTHAVYSDDVIYNNLALAIIDEQQRFGVNQRKKISDKTIKLNIIHLTATPIPRTLSMLLFNGMDISLIKDKPEGRLKIKTAIIGEDYRERTYDLMKKEIAAGNKCYVICPLIEDEEDSNLRNVKDYAKDLKKIFDENNTKIQILHGRMKDEEKEKIMKDFVDGDTNILVATTVIEVGIDSKDATFILIENAECYGLSTLHQLRGRVGRKDKQSYCVIVDGLNSENSRNRLNILSESDDGFYIAEKDLELRGGGDIFGVNQSGELGFVYADIYKDKNELKMALNDANDIIDTKLLDTDGFSKLKCRLDEYIKNGYTI